MAEASLLWVPCLLRRGHGVASGRSAESPYPAGTIALQTPWFRERGVELSPYYAGTLNLEARGAWSLRDPDARIEELRWTEHHPPETFSFWRCRLRLPLLQPAGAPAAGGFSGAGIEALIYHPHPETKQAHHQPPGCLEVLAPWLGPLQTGCSLELGVDPGRCRLIDSVRLRARLLEFLKFRVLAAQAEFFTAFLEPAETPACAGAEEGGDNSGATARGPIDPARVRRWLSSLWPEALALSDADLLATLEQARGLYVN